MEGIDPKLIWRIIRKRRHRRKCSFPGDISWAEVAENYKKHYPKLLLYLNNYPASRSHSHHTFIVMGKLVYVPCLYERIAQLCICENLINCRDNTLPYVFRGENTANRKFQDSLAIGHIYCTRIDVANYFASIRQVDILTHVKKYFTIEDETLHGIIQVIRAQCHTVGIKIGFPLNSYLADDFLSPVDMTFHKSLFRFHDDFFFFSSKKEEHLDLVSQLEIVLSEYCLKINTKKTLTLRHPKSIYDFIT